MKKVFYLLIIIFTLTIFYSAGVDAQSKKTKKHWSHRKKDAVIGGTAGAATGAIVSKHHVKGAVIGGAVGAGAGYIVGKKKDKKEKKGTK
jgi:outer membrane lipoprotein SlyB